MRKGMGLTEIEETDTEMVEEFLQPNEDPRRLDHLARSDQAAERYHDPKPIRSLDDLINEPPSLRRAVEEWHEYGLVEAAAERAYAEAGEHPRAMSAALEAGIAEGLRQYDDKFPGSVEVGTRTGNEEEVKSELIGMYLFTRWELVVGIGWAMAIGAAAMFLVCEVVG